jgi:hypothetical protein
MNWDIRELKFVPVGGKDYDNQIGVVGGSWRIAPDEALDFARRSSRKELPYPQ